LLFAVFQSLFAIRPKEGGAPCFSLNLTLIKQAHKEIRIIGKGNLSKAFTLRLCTFVDLAVV